jgi:DNA polymerase III alpha subunit
MLESDSIPIFSSCYSIGRSILSLDKPAKDGWPKVISIFDIAKNHKLNEVKIVDDTMGGFYQAYKQSKDLKIKLIWGVFINVVNSLKEFDKQTSSQVIVWLKNGAGYAELNKILYYMNTDGYRKDLNAKGEELTYGYPYIDWETLNSMWTSNLECSIPFYSGFLSHNLFSFDHFSAPVFEKIQPTLMLSQQGLPFDEIIKENVVKYGETSGYPISKVRHVYYYEPKFAKSLLTMRAILNRGTMEKPETRHFCSDRFSYLDYNVEESNPVTDTKEIPLGERNHVYV